MDLVIKKLPNKKREITEKERQIIQRALISYKIVLGQYEKYTLDMKRKDLERLAKQSETGTLDAMNPFNVNVSDKETYEPSLEDTKQFVYSSWAEAVANVQTPYVCDGSKKKGIRRQAFRDVQNGKFLTKKVRETMDEFIDRLMYGKSEETDEENK